MIDRRLIVAKAREYIDTPYLHQGRVRGSGIDCVGLIIGIAHELGISDFDIDGYGMRPDGETFRRIMREQMDEKPFDQRSVGDVLSFAFEHEQHVGVIVDLEPLIIVHCWAKVGRCVEHEVDAKWLRRLRGCWSYRLS